MTTAICFVSENPKKKKKMHKSVKRKNINVFVNINVRFSDVIRVQEKS